MPKFVCIINKLGSERGTQLFTALKKLPKCAFSAKIKSDFIFLSAFSRGVELSVLMGKTISGVGRHFSFKHFLYVSRQTSVEMKLP